MKVTDRESETVREAERLKAEQTVRSCIKSALHMRTENVDQRGKSD